jgi:hypothetical protein
MAGPTPRLDAPGTDPALAASERAMSASNDRFQTARAFGEAIDAAQADRCGAAPTVIGVHDRRAGGRRRRASPAGASVVDSTIPVGRPDYDAILEAEALAAAPEWGPAGCPTG